ncbi:hypothetical protein ONA91_11950 [Micromonospora sp. DR5-3]|uniref:hypothetical protein n=1 Tax=unclassified Micromonospora TaxID=2617518 RepID=UPI0011DBE9B7|nr:MULTISPECIES: hypothetical protein [unclassified Micromonospora]MCW3815168.1 hypothetical protein [Micromonospora sp. DR5-3]TYC22207.1 hypothetical protein FXF52_21645 [Micromonospora sp. MP36]
MRTANRIATLLLAVALLAAGALAVAEGLLAALGRPGLLIHRWYATLTTTRWQDAPVRAVAAGVALFGLVVLAAELRRWRPARLRLAADDGWHLHRRSVERRLARAVCAVPSVRRARVRLRRRGDAWRPRVIATADPAARADVEFALRRELDRLAAPRRGRIEVRLLPARRST